MQTAEAEAEAKGAVSGFWLAQGTSLQVIASGAVSLKSKRSAAQCPNRQCMEPVREMGLQQYVNKEARPHAAAQIAGDGAAGAEAEAEATPHRMLCDNTGSLQDHQNRIGDQKASKNETFLEAQRLSGRGGGKRRRCLWIEIETAAEVR
ncbi:hypothetical protein C8R45DRAFT_932085 [Mycena sanguinolenta]|nr:hypothetical protein C8R45DRAFT_932085 [Mycena sanguinolenta]